MSIHRAAQTFHFDVIQNRRVCVTHITQSRNNISVMLMSVIEEEGKFPHILLSPQSLPSLFSKYVCPRTVTSEDLLNVVLDFTSQPEVDKQREREREMERDGERENG